MRKSLKIGWVKLVPIETKLDLTVKNPSAAKKKREGLYGHPYLLRQRHEHEGRRARKRGWGYSSGGAGKMRGGKELGHARERGMACVRETKSESREAINIGLAQRQEGRLFSMGG